MTLSSLSLPTLDGRLARGARARAAIVDALLDWPRSWQALREHEGDSRRPRRAA